MIRDARPESNPPAGILSNEVNDAGVLTSLKPPDTERVPNGSLMLISKRDLADAEYTKAVALFRYSQSTPPPRRAGHRPRRTKRGHGQRYRGRPTAAAARAR